MRKTILALGSAAALSISGAGIATAQPDVNSNPNDTTAEASPIGSAAQMLCSSLGDGSPEGDATTPTTPDTAGADTDADTETGAAETTTGTDTEGESGTTGDATDGATIAEPDTTGEATDGATIAEPDTTGDATGYQDTATDPDNLEGIETEQDSDDGVATGELGAEAGATTAAEAGTDTEPATGTDLPTAQTETEAGTADGSLGALAPLLAGPDCAANITDLLEGLAAGDLTSASAVLSTEAANAEAEAEAPGAVEDQAGTTDPTNQATTDEDQVEADALTTEDDSEAVGAF